VSFSHSLAVKMGCNGSITSDGYVISVGRTG